LAPRPDHAQVDPFNGPQAPVDGVGLVVEGGQDEQGPGQGREL